MSLKNEKSLGTLKHFLLINHNNLQKYKQTYHKSHVVHVYKYVYNVIDINTSQEYLSIKISLTY